MIKVIFLSILLIITKSFCEPSFSGYIQMNNLPKINEKIILDENNNIYTNIGIIKKIKIEFDNIKNKENCKNKDFEIFLNNKDSDCNINYFINKDSSKETLDVVINKYKRKIKVLGFEKIENLNFIYIQIIDTLN